MPVKKTKSTSAAKSAIITPASPMKKGKLFKKVFTRKNLVVFAVIVVALLLWWAKNWFIVATVNGQPISRFELNSRLNSQFADTVIDQLINERLVLGAARQQGVFITSQQIDDRIKELEKGLQGKMTLDQALSLQGLTPTTFRHQLELQLSIEKIFESQATVSADEIDKYITTNKDQFADATDEAQLKSDVKNYLKQQKISQLYQDWFDKIKADAKINKNI